MILEELTILISVGIVVGKLLISLIVYKTLINDKTSIDDRTLLDDKACKIRR